ncbi:thioesterase II family protein [Streptomyces sp. NPDC093094]|uniref:thioesterase II family protein n=1 Tax=Streptomyces sp. NPDC093094 TaxID=3366026 RepID=UPI00380A2128
MTAASRETKSWIRRFAPADGATTQLVCLPHAGGSAPFFLPVARALAPHTDVLAVQYPGRQDRREEPGIESIPELAEQVTRAIVESADRPVTLFGHSMGASVAFEVARRLPGTGVEVLGLIVSGRCAPPCGCVARRKLSTDENILDEIRRLSGTDARVLSDEDLVRMILPSLRSDYAAVTAYRAEPGARVPYPVLALIGDADPQVPVEDARAWREHTDSEDFELRVFPGGHFYLNDQPEAVIDTVRRHIARWSSTAPVPGGVV